MFTVRQNPASADDDKLSMAVRHRDTPPSNFAGADEPRGNPGGLAALYRSVVANDPSRGKRPTVAQYTPPLDHDLLNSDAIGTTVGDRSSRFDLVNSFIELPTDSEVTAATYSRCQLF